LNHDEKLALLCEQLRNIPPGQRVKVLKGSVSHFVPNPRRKAPTNQVDLRAFDQLLDIDTENLTATAEPGVSFEHLVAATLRYGLIPYTVPELKGITVGGAVSGCSIESMSYRFGGFHDKCLEYEVVSAEGEVLSCSREQNAELFEAVHGAYGTLGILSSLRFELRPAKRYVQMDYHHFRSFDEYWDFLQDRCARGEDDFIDGIIHSPCHFTACIGTMVDRTPYISRYDWLEIYYRSTAQRERDFLRIEDYFFRYDAECHWLTRTVPLLERKPVRFALGKFLLGSEKLISWSKRLAPLMKLKRRPEIVIDVFIPRLAFPRFFDWYKSAFDFWPLWIVPYRMPHGIYPWLRDDFAARIGEAFVIDCAIYGKVNNHPTIDLSKVLEDKVYELNGIKTLISRNHYDEETFWSIYSKERYDAAKARLDPKGRLGGLYEKMCRVE
jgi:FAD/FMN-containing dehydrogenase